MTTSEGEPAEAFVWVWLPGAAEPVVAGRLDRAGAVTTFTYGGSYLSRPDPISLFLPELPLQRGPIGPRVGELAGCIADALPDAWGRRVIAAARRGRGLIDDEPGTLGLLLGAGSDRIGALDIQRSASAYVSRATATADLAELVDAAARVEAGEALHPSLDLALLHGSSIGGARPKALLAAPDRPRIAKFSSTSDPYPVVRGECLAMELARRAGIDAARVELTRVLDRDVLLVDRFDRPGGGRRRLMVSALTILGLDEIAGRYASYADLADVIRDRFTDANATLRELFARITFSILVGNTDDHARNHAAFWDGEALTLTPAYDICPQPRGGGEAAQVMGIAPDGWRMSQVAGCVERAGHYLLTRAEARAIVDHQLSVIRGQWDDACDVARLSAGERVAFRGRQFLNEYALLGY